MLRTVFLIVTLLLSAVLALAQPQEQSTSAQPQSHNPHHQRITKTEAIGTRQELTTLKGAILFKSPSVNRSQPVPLLVHFHGAPWLIEAHIARHLPKVALITVQLGAGSSAYRRPFENPDLFRELMNEAAQMLSLKRGWSSLTLTGFSAGYGGVRQILRRPEYFALVDNVLLLDGLHASYADERNLEEQKEPNERSRKVLHSHIDIYVSFAREAAFGSSGSRARSKPHARGKSHARATTRTRTKTFVVTHSEIFPGTYASTTECADYLLAQLSLNRRSKPMRGPMGMQQLSAVDAGGFRVRGYAGNTARDHVDFLHAMPAWFRLLRIK